MHQGKEFAVPDSIVARDIIFKNKMSYLREKLAADTRFRLPMAEYEQWLQANDVPRAEGIEFLKALHTAGLVLYYPHRAPNYIFLRPRAVTRELLNLLDPDGTIAAALMQTKTTNLAKLEAQYAELTKQKQALDEAAARKGSRWVKIMMASVVAQAAIMTRLIWWELSWDVMEPVAYLLGFSYLTFGWGWYLVSRDDIAEYGSIAGKYISSSKQKLYNKNGFSLDAYTKIGDEIERQKSTLKSFGVVRPKDRRFAYPIPAKPVEFNNETAPQPTLNAAAIKT